MQYRVNPSLNNYTSVENRSYAHYRDKDVKNVKSCLFEEMEKKDM